VEPGFFVGAVTKWKREKDLKTGAQRLQKLRKSEKTTI
jgi:hypothetical protein